MFRGFVKEGRFRPDEAPQFAARLAHLEGRRVRVSVKRERVARTLSANRYYFGVVLATLAEWSGHDPEELHEFMKQSHLGWRSRELPSGLGYSVRPSTATLTVEEFARYVDNVVKWAAEQGVYVPSPEEV